MVTVTRGGITQRAVGNRDMPMHDMAEWRSRQSICVLFERFSTQSVEDEHHQHVETKKYSGTWELVTPDLEGLCKTVLSSEVVLFPRFISGYWILGLGTEIAVRKSQVVPISQVVLKTLLKTLFHCVFEVSIVCWIQLQNTSLLPIHWERRILCICYIHSSTKESKVPIGSAWTINSYSRVRACEVLFSLDELVHVQILRPVLAITNIITNIVTSTLNLPFLTGYGRYQCGLQNSQGISAPKGGTVMQPVRCPWPSRRGLLKASDGSEGLVASPEALEGMARGGYGFDVEGLISCFTSDNAWTPELYDPPTSFIGDGRVPCVFK